MEAEVLKNSGQGRSDNQVRRYGTVFESQDIHIAFCSIMVRQFRGNSQGCMQGVSSEGKHREWNWERCLVGQRLKVLLEAQTESSTCMTLMTTPVNQNEYSLTSRQRLRAALTLGEE